MDPRFSHESKMRKRMRFRRMCSLCNEPCRDTDDQMRHYSSALHKHMKRIKRKQYSYTKNLRSLDEKIKASEEHKEPLIGLEYIYQYAADRRGVIPYVCTLCDCVYKINTIFFHIAGIKHRTMYLGKNFPAMGFDRNFKMRTLSDFRRLLTAAEIIEKTHGRRKINVSNAIFSPKKNDGITYDSDSGDEGLSSEDEHNNPDLNSAFTKANDGNNNRSVNRSGNIPFQHDFKGGLPLSNVGRGDPAFCYDGRRGPEVQDSYSDMNHPPRDHEVSGFHNDGRSDRTYHDARRDMNHPSRDHEASGFQHEGPSDRNYPNGRSDMNRPPRNQDISELHDHSNRNYPEHNDRLPMELSYQQRGPDRRKVPDRTDFPGDRNPRSQMNRDGTAFQCDDRQGPKLQGHDGIMSQNRPQNRPLGFSEDRNLGSQMHRGGLGFQYDNTRPLGNPHIDLDMPSMGQLGQQVAFDDIRSKTKTENHPPGFFGDHDLQTPMHRGGMRAQGEAKAGPLLQGDRGHSGSQVRKDDRGFAFDESTPLLDNPRGDLGMPSMGPLSQLLDRNGNKSRNRTLNHPSDFSGDFNLGSQTRQGGKEFQYDDRHRSSLQGGFRQTGNQVREKEFAFNPDQSAPVIGAFQGDPNMPSMGQLHQQVDGDDFKSRGRTQRHPLDFPSDNFKSTMHRDGMEFLYEDRQRPMLQGDSRPTDNQVKNDGRGFAFQHDPSTRLLGNTHGGLDIQGQNRTPGFPGGTDLGSRMHRDTAAFQYDGSRGPMLQDAPRDSDRQVRNDDRSIAFRHEESRLGTLHGALDMQSMGQIDPEAHRGGMPFRYDDPQGVVPQGGLGHTSDRQREPLLPNVHSGHAVPPMKSFYQQGDRYAFEERPSTEAFHPGFSGDHSLHSQKNRGGMVHDGPSGVHSKFQMRGDRITFRELKAAHESGFDLQHISMDEKGVNYDSDMEVRSMDLSECDPDQFLCNAELFEFVKTFQIQSYEDEQFALKVKDFFANGSLRYRNYKEEALRRRIAEEKEKLEEEKKAFLEIQRLKERPKKENLTTAARRNQAPDPSSYFPIAAPKSRGQSGKPRPLMSLMIDLPPEPANEPPHSPSYRGQESVEELRTPTMPAKNTRPGATSKSQHSPNYPRRRGSMDELRSQAIPAKNLRPESQSRRNQEFIQTPSEMRRGERSNQPPLRGDHFPSRGHSDGARELPSRFAPHTQSMNY